MDELVCMQIFHIFIGVYQQLRGTRWWGIWQEAEVAALEAQCAEQAHKKARLPSEVNKNIYLSKMSIQRHYVAPIL